VSTFGLGARRRIVRPSPLFLVVVAITAVGGLIAWTEQGAGSRFGDFGVLLLVLGGWVISVCFHEFAHAFAAYRAGDRSVEARGYLTLNPFKYAHPVLSILLPLVFIVSGGIGLPGGAVYLHPHTFRSKASRSIAAASGPAVNLVLGVVCIWFAKNNETDVLSHLNYLFAPSGSGDIGHARFWCAVAFLGLLQMTAAVLNLLPVPGLDGWAIIEPYLAPETVRGAEPVKPWGLLGVFVLLQVQQINNAFFTLAYRAYEVSGLDRLSAEIGRQVFRFWQKQPL
jgi:Zn-dependent protease